MNTEQLFQTDAYLHSFNATVVASDAEQGRVALDRTAFYPGGGGQPNDVGTLTANGNALAVKKVKKDGNHIWHWLEGGLPAEGTTVAGALDWPRRYALMRTHTAMHIMVGVVFRDYGAKVTGGNMEPLVGRLDFEFESLTREMVSEIEKRLNAEVEAERDTVVRILPRDEAFQIPDLIRTRINLLPEGITEVRTVEIIGLDYQADGGTHVRNTREVGPIEIIEYKSKGKINKRLKIRLHDD